MTDKTQLNKIIKKMYASELDLIDSAPAMKIKKQGMVAVLKDALWNKQSIAIKFAILSFFLAAIFGSIYYYNFFTINSFKVKMQRAHIEVQLQRRNDLIPNIITAVNEYMDYEKHVFVHAADVRAAVQSIQDAVKQQKTSGSKEPVWDTSLLSKFQAVAEAYPALKASETYKNLMKELSNTESQIAQMRHDYTKEVNFHNSRLKMFPGFLFNRIFRFEPVETFESDPQARSAPRVGNTNH